IHISGSTRQTALPTTRKKGELGEGRGCCRPGLSWDTLSRSPRDRGAVRRCPSTLGFSEPLARQGENALHKVGSVSSMKTRRCLAASCMPLANHGLWHRTLRPACLLTALLSTDAFHAIKCPARCL